MSVDRREFLQFLSVFSGAAVMPSVMKGKEPTVEPEVVPEELGPGRAVRGGEFDTDICAEVTFGFVGSVSLMDSKRHRGPLESQVLVGGTACPVVSWGLNSNTETLSSPGIPFSDRPPEVIRVGMQSYDLHITTYDPETIMYLQDLNMAGGTVAVEIETDWKTFSGSAIITEIELGGF